MRIYVGKGQKHGMRAKDIAGLLSRAGGIPSRLVDEIEMKDYCSFATMPTDAARKACVFSRKESKEPVIRLAQERGAGDRSAQFPKSSGKRGGF